MRALSRGRGWLTVCIAVTLLLTYWLVNTMTRPIMAPYAASLGAGPGEIGVILAALALPAAVCAIPIGAAADRMGYRPVLICGAVALLAGIVGLMLITTPMLLLVPQTLIGTGSVAVWLALQGLMIEGFGAAAEGSEEGRDRRTRRITNYSTLAVAGQLGGPLFGGVIADGWSSVGAFGVAAGLSLVCLLSGILLPRVQHGSTGGGSGERLSARVVARSYVRGFRMLREPGVMLTMLVSFVALYLMDVRNGFQPLYFHGVGMTATLIGAVLSVGGVFALMSRLIVVYALRRFRNGTVVIWCLAPGAAATCCVVLFTSVPPFFVLGALAGLLLGVAQPLTLSLTADYTKEFERGMGIGLRMVANRVAQTVDPMVFGGLVSLSGFGLAFGATGIALGSAAVAIGWWLNRGERPGEPDPAVRATGARRVRRGMRAADGRDQTATRQ